MKQQQATTVLAILLVAVGLATTITFYFQPLPEVVVTADTGARGWSTRSLPAGSRRRLRFLVRTAHPPFSYVPEDGGEPTGLDVDVARALADHLGVECSVVPMPGEQIVSRFLRGEGDVLASSASPNPALQRFLDFTGPCYRSRGALLVRAGQAERFAEGLPEHARLGLLRGTAHGQALLASVGCGEPPVPDMGWAELVSCLKEGRRDGVLADALAAYYQLSKRPDCGVVLVPLPVPVRHSSAVCLAVRKGATGLRKALDGGLRDLQMDGTLRRVHHRYFPFDIE
jgi:polar amino acid transport system substrate-binding protein